MLQTDLLFLMVDGAAPRITVVGDDDQCIYAFRGAEPGNFVRVREHFTREAAAAQHAACAGSAAPLFAAPFAERQLTDNYRSSANILEVAGRFLRGCARREHKALQPTRAAGAPVELWRCAVGD